MGFRIALPPMSPRRYIFAVIVLVISIHFILSLSHSKYKDATSISTLAERIRPKPEPPKPPVRYTKAELLQAAARNYTQYLHPNRENATFVLLCRNSDMNGAVMSIQGLEDRFNHKYNYPWVLLNDEPFTEEFKRRVSVVTSAPIHFGLIPKDHWQQPEWIDENKAKEGREKMESQGIIYAGSVPYRNMCRFNSGFFYKHELMKPYRYYWRVEPDVKFFCDINYDPFKYMVDNNKTYGYTLALVEWEQTIPSLWATVKEFTELHPQYLAKDNSMPFISDDFGAGYNLCHYWSNFEIADMDFWRGEAYQKFFDFLESKGGFYYERWGDAPVHSIGISLFAPRREVHYFRDIGYRHENFQHCPKDEEWAQGRCACDYNDTFDYGWGSCQGRYDNLFN